MKTQKEAITNAVFNCRKLTSLDAVAMFGTIKLDSRISEIEKKYGIRLDRKWVKFTSRYGTAGKYYIYQLNRNKYANEIKKYKESCKVKVK